VSDRLGIGGKEAERSNSLLHSIVASAIEEGSGRRVDGAACGLISRLEIPALLQMDAFIDLVIPRGGGELVNYIKVMGAP